MKKGLGIALASVFAGVVLPSAWHRLFLEAKGFSVTQWIVAIVGGILLYLIANVIGEIVESRRGSHEDGDRSASGRRP